MLGTSPRQRTNSKRRASLPLHHGSFWGGDSFESVMTGTLTPNMILPVSGFIIPRTTCGSIFMFSLETLVIAGKLTQNFHSSAKLPIPLAVAHINIAACLFSPALNMIEGIGSESPGRSALWNLYEKVLSLRIPLIYDPGTNLLHFESTE